MLEPQRKDRLRTLAVGLDGSVTEGDPVPLRNTLFAHAFGMEEAALLRCEPPKERGLEGTALRLKLARTLQKGVREFRVLGSGHGLRGGKLYAVLPRTLARAGGYFDTAEDALAYGGLLFSEAAHVLRLDSARVTSRGAGDGQGWIDPLVLEEHGLPVRQVQVRALWPRAIAKGTLLPREGTRKEHGCDVLFHETQLKGKGRDLSGEFLLAIRDTAQPRTFNSSWTWTQFLDEELQERLFDRHARPMLAIVRRAMESNDSALAFLEAIPCAGEEERERRDILTGLLASGLSPRHPWVHRRLQELVRRTYLDAALGLGPIPLHGGMAACADDDRLRHEVTANWLPEGPYALLRYPVRDGDSLRLVRNIHRPGIPEGTIAVHPDRMEALDGDYDGDWVALCSDRDVQRGVARMHRPMPKRLPIPPRTRKRSPLAALPLVAVESMGATGIGTPTWYVAACVEQGREDLIPGLSLALQCATMSLKWSVEKDWGLMDRVAEETSLPAWLELAQERRMFTTAAEKVPDIGLGRWWNACVDAFDEDVRTGRGSLTEFLHVMPLPEGDPGVLAEVETMRQVFNRKVAGSHGDEDVIRAAIDEVRDWAGGKRRHRTEYGRAAWYLCHKSPSSQSTGSFAIHAFPDVIARDLQHGLGYRPPVLCPSGAECSAMVETVEGREVLRAQKRVRVPVERSDTRTLMVRLIGGQKAVQARYEVSEKEAGLYLERVIEEKGPEPVPLTFAWVNAPWNGHRVIEATLGDEPIGYVPEEQAHDMERRVLGTKEARLLCRGKSVYAVVSQ